MGPFTESGNRLFFKLAGEGHSELLQREDPIKESKSGDDEQVGIVSSHPQESERERVPPGTRMHACETPHGLLSTPPAPCPCTHLAMSMPFTRTYGASPQLRP